jgi:hypothetical protein
MKKGAEGSLRKASRCLSFCHISYHMPSSNHYKIMTLKNTSARILFYYILQANARTAAVAAQRHALHEEHEKAKREAQAEAQRAANGESDAALLREERDALKVKG